MTGQVQSRVMGGKKPGKAEAAEEPSGSRPDRSRHMDLAGH